MHTYAQLIKGELSGITRLTLSENLTEFPLEILSLADSLEILDLSNNQLSNLPDELVQLSQLKIIFASNNRFEHLPEVLGKLPLLEMVGFKANQIKTVSANALPQQLRWLILTENKLETLPETLGERPRLQKLALAGNKLTHLPKSMSQCLNLELIRISANQLTEFPAQLFALPKLAWLAFAGNPFSKNINNASTSSVPELPSSSFTLHQQLGQGASGVISKASWNSPQSKYPAEIAVKVFKGEVTSDGYPKDELDSCLQVGIHPNLVQSLAQVNEESYLALIMDLIPSHYRNLGLPPNFSTCTRDTFSKNTKLSLHEIQKIVKQMTAVFEHIHKYKVSHGDLYAHNTLVDDDANIIFGDFGAASMYHMLTEAQQRQIKAIEKRALHYFIEDLLSICEEVDKNSEAYRALVLLTH